MGLFVIQNAEQGFTGLAQFVGKQIALPGFGMTPPPVSNLNPTVEGRAIPSGTKENVIMKTNRAARNGALYGIQNAEQDFILPDVVSVRPIVAIWLMEGFSAIKNPMVGAPVHQWDADRGLKKTQHCVIPPVAPDTTGSGPSVGKIARQVNLSIVRQGAPPLKVYAPKRQSIWLLLPLWLPSIF